MEATHSPGDIARARAEIEARRREGVRQRIVGMRHAERLMPAKEIAYRVGVSAAYVEEVLGK